MWPTLEHVVVSFVVLSLLSAGCGQTFPERARDDSFMCRDCEETEPTEGETEPTGEEVEPSVEIDNPEVTIEPEPTEPSEPDEVCTPRPAVREATDYPELPDRASDPSCPLTETRVDEHGDGRIDRTTKWSRGDGALIKLTEGPGDTFTRILWSRGWTSSGDRRLRHVERRRRYSRYSSNVQLDSWSFDREGRLVRKTYADFPDKHTDEANRRQTIEQTFRDGRLVSRTETNEELDGTSSTKQTTYRYEDGRLAEIVHEDGDERWVANWQYDDGRPVQVDYALNGQQAYEQTWEFHDDGRLDSRSLVFRSAMIDDNGSLRVMPRLTDMTPTYTSPRSRSASGGSIGQAPKSTFADRGACSRVPVSARHGYPRSERVYRAAFEDGSVPRYTDQAYGYPGYGVWDDNAWYGHSGLFSAGPLGRGQYDPNGDGLRVTLEYDDRERMVRQSTTLDSEEDPAVRVFRTRTFADDDLVEDHILKMRGELGEQRSLEFRYDNGRLTGRRLRIGGEVAEKQSWTVRDGRDVELAISYREGHRGRPLWNDLGATPSFGDTPFETTTYTREFDDQGRRTRFSVEPDGFHRDEIRTTHGPHGPVERIEVRGDSEERTRFEYDDAGRRIAEKHDRDNDDDYEYVEQWNYDDAGRLIEQTRERDSQGLTHRRRDVYACTADTD